jgi:SpoVK/Ycf46/Vps4 family AAA+-type ATPase
MPNPGVVAGFMLIGIGVGMVVARYGKMGVFQGEFGSPWFETDLSDLLRKEIARAARFERELSIAVVRQHDGDAIDWSAHTRQADDIIQCRNGWRVLVLPETPKDGVQSMIERARANTGADIEAIVMDPSVAHLKNTRLEEAMLDLIRNPPAAGSPVPVRRDTDRLRLPVR